MLKFGIAFNISGKCWLDCPPEIWAAGETLPPPLSHPRGDRSSACWNDPRAAKGGIRDTPGHPVPSVPSCLSSCCKERCAGRAIPADWPTEVNLWPEPAACDHITATRSLHADRQEGDPIPPENRARRAFWAVMGQGCYFSLLGSWALHFTGVTLKMAAKAKCWDIYNPGSEKCAALLGMRCAWR